MKYAITLSATMPVQQFVVVEAPTKEEALKALNESIREDLKDSLKIISIEELTEEDFNEILEDQNLEEVEEDYQSRSIN